MSEYTRIIWREHDDEGNTFYVARHPELEGCISQGATPEEAKEMLEEARGLYLAALAQAGLEPPPPWVWC